MILLQLRSVYCGNDKDENVSFYDNVSFWRLFDITITVIKDNDGNIERYLAGWKYCNLYYFYTMDFFNLYNFCLIFAPRIMTML